MVLDCSTGPCWGDGAAATLLDMTNLTTQMEMLARRLDALEVENTQLRAQLDDAPATTPAESRRFGRRNLLRLGGAAAAVGAGSVLLRPGVAGATTGAMQFGAANNAVGDETSLTSSSPQGTLTLSNSLSGAALRATNNSTFGLGGVAISAHTTNANNTLPALNVTDDGLGGAIFCEVTNENVTSPAIFGIVDAGNVAVFEAENDGTGMGLYAHVENAASAARPVYALTKGTGQGVLASIANAASKSAAVRAATTGSGIGVDASSALGMGGRFAGRTAQVQLVPSTSFSSHPSSGSAGQLFVDKSKRLWFCKGGTSWKQLA
jgi:hypothetical protein